MKGKLDPYTLRHVALWMRKRANLLRRENQKPMHFAATRDGRALELDLQADKCRELARESEPRKITFCGPHWKAKARKAGKRK